MFRKLMGGLRDLTGGVSRWWRAGSIVLIVLALFVPVVWEKVVEKTVDAVAGALQITEMTAMLVLLFSAALVILVAVLLFMRGGREPLPAELARTHTVHRRLDREDVKRVQRDLIDPVFRGANAEEENILEMYRKNPVMGVALSTAADNRYVAFATAWPLTGTAAERILSGAITENDLTPDDVLPESGNAAARHLLIPVVVVRDANRSDGTFYQLVDAFKQQLCENYFAGADHPITFIATGFSEGGKTMCRRWGFTWHRSVTMSGREVPVYTATLTRAGLGR